MKIELDDMQSQAFEFARQLDVAEGARATELDKAASHARESADRSEAEARKIRATSADRWASVMTSIAQCHGTGEIPGTASIRRDGDRLYIEWDAEEDHSEA